MGVVNAVMEFSSQDLFFALETKHVQKGLVTQSSAAVECQCVEGLARRFENVL